MNDDYELLEKLSKEQLECYKTAFGMFDKNNNGKIKTSELLSLMRSLGENPTEDDIQNIINETDLNKDGRIDFSEFLKKIVERQAIYNSTEDLRLAFSFFDGNGDGTVNVREIRDIILVIANVLSVEVEELVQQLCRTQELRIDYEELLLMIKGFEVRESIKRDIFNDSSSC